MNLSVQYSSSDPWVLELLALLNLRLYLFYLLSEVVVCCGENV